ncbi:MAG TPA: IPT/TIG domain-containing protein [Solirubrobacterales bacterium]|nr:IPT/TIG domain-containing protein [Solirubrobacterales bacterium]
MVRRLRTSVLLVSCLFGLLGIASAAQGATVTVGSLHTDVVESTTAGSTGTLTFANPVVGLGGLATSPVDGTIVRWHITGATGGPFTLRVLRPVPGGYMGVATSGGAVPSSLGTQTFATSLPIRAGDLIGLNTSNKTDQVGAAIAPGSLVAAWQPALPEGTTSGPTVTASNAEVTFNAEVQPAPKIVALSPSSGSIAGGTSVTLSGSDFTGATAVSFGGVPAALFPVQSDSSLTVVAPKTAKPGAVAVTVTTLAGTSAAVPFTYTACVVPKVKGKKLKAAKKALRKANCKPGNVSGKGPKVVKQGVKPGSVRPVGAKVSLKRG